MTALQFDQLYAIAWGAGLVVCFGIGYLGGHAR